MYLGQLLGEDTFKVAEEKSKNICESVAAHLISDLISIRLNQQKYLCRKMITTAKGSAIASTFLESAFQPSLTWSSIQLLRKTITLSSVHQ